MSSRSRTPLAIGRRDRPAVALLSSRRARGHHLGSRDSLPCRPTARAAPQPAKPRPPLWVGARTDGRALSPSPTPTNPPIPVLAGPPRTRLRRWFDAAGRVAVVVQFRTRPDRRAVFGPCKHGRLPSRITSGCRCGGRCAVDSAVAPVRLAHSSLLPVGVARSPGRRVAGGRRERPGSDRLAEPRPALALNSARAARPLHPSSVGGGRQYTRRPCRVGGAVAPHSPTARRRRRAVQHGTGRAFRVGVSDRSAQQRGGNWSGKGPMLTRTLGHPASRTSCRASGPSSSAR
jgi:hypothetical protein